jgi:hypothetical protein
VLVPEVTKMSAANPKTGTGLSVRPEDEIGSIADRCLQVPILRVLSFPLPFQMEVKTRFLCVLPYLYVDFDVCLPKLLMLCLESL